MASLMTGLWQLAVVVMIFSHISASLPSLERNQRQIELKLMHDAGMRREYEKAAKLLQTLMNYKRSVPRASAEKDTSGFIDKETSDSWNSEEKLFNLKTCLHFVQNLDVRHRRSHRKANGSDYAEEKKREMQRSERKVNFCLCKVCSVENPDPSIEENNDPGIVVTNITTAAGVTVTIDPQSTMNPHWFEINGSQLILKHSVDYEENSLTITLTIINVNDNPPIFKETNITVYVNEDENAVHTASAEITIHILQADLRPPWFQPCTLIGGHTVCISHGYTGKVNISENVTEPLILEPGPLYAIDGDRDLDETIIYEIADGNDYNTFSINKYTGNITMNKPANTLQTFMLYIVASQENNPFRYSQTTVEIKVVHRNDHRPDFNTTYMGTVSVDMPVSSLVMEAGRPSAIANDTVALQEARTLITVDVLPLAIPRSKYERDMAVLGGTLGSLLVITLVLLGLIFYKYYKLKNAPEEDNTKIGKSCWDLQDALSCIAEKPLHPLPDASSDVFPFLQNFTNTNFENDDKPNSDGKADELPADLEAEDDNPGTPSPLEIAVVGRLASAVSEAIKSEEKNEDGEKEVRSILTKDRRNADDDGYKAVWFKEDIDPEAKDDVLLIEDDSNAEWNRNESDGDTNEEEDVDDNDDDHDNGSGDDSGRGSDVSIIPGRAHLPETQSTLNESLENTEENVVYL
ncbi:hypothetical protein JD844_021994 [Phrynosoma platyrhinos]|uniref:Cadherin domain-containing protein n=1 Tax=Phrynosoma platyrhinos TaxID=52577 RepID=A0ABQ7SUH4_PHRPL|nr:hypothetical protein JD844_021994 [Phrynosoma platyrhinos]